MSELDKNQIEDIIKPSDLIETDNISSIQEKSKEQSRIILENIEPEITEKEKEELGKKLIDTIKNNGTIEDVETLLNKGANVNFRFYKGYEISTPLMYAAGYGSIDIMKLLIKRKANINWFEPLDNVGTALHYAAKNGNEEACMLLLENGARMNIVDGEGYKIYNIAYLYNHKILAEKLLKIYNIQLIDKLPEIDQKLHVAVVERKVNEVFNLIKKGANVNAIDGDGYNLLNNVCFFNRSKLIIQSRNEIISLLFQNDFKNINQIDPKGNTVLIMAAYFGDLELVKILVNNYADPLIKDTERNQTAYSWAIDEGHLNVANYLKEIQK